MLEIQIKGREMRLWLAIPGKGGTDPAVVEALSVIVTALEVLMDVPLGQVTLTGARLTPDGWQALLWPVADAAWPSRSDTPGTEAPTASPSSTEDSLPNSTSTGTPSWTTS